MLTRTGKSRVAVLEAALTRVAQRRTVKGKMGAGVQPDENRIVLRKSTG